MRGRNITPSQTSNKMGSSVTELDCLIIGAGFSGCYQLRLLREAGFNVKVVDAASEIGGVWAWNRYPGARVDMEMPYYGYSDPKVWATWNWTERFPDEEELLRYFRHVDKVWDLSKDIQLNVTIVSTTFEQGDNGPRWVSTTSTGDIYYSKFLVCGTGTSFKPYVPKFEGLENYKGVACHSSSWPKDVDMTGKRVAVIGAGASAVQVVQEAAKVATKVTEFIRTPNIALPMRQRRVSPEEIDQYRLVYPYVFKELRKTILGLPGDGTDKKTFDVTEDERRAVWEEGWNKGGFAWYACGFIDVSVDEKANRAAYDFWAEKTRARIRDPKKRDLLAPLEPPYFLGTKRPSLEIDYYGMCDRDNVEITNSPILHFTETGVTTEERSEDFDIVAICTGYDAVTGGLMTMNIQGVNGVYLHEKWADGVSTFLGLMSHGFPNMFMMYGPQAPTSFTNGPVFLELECEWVRDVLVRMRDEKKTVIDAKQTKEAEWCQIVHGIANQTLAVRTDSWYMGANIPGKKRECLLYLGGIPSWHESCQKSLENWEGFDTHGARTSAA